MPLAAAIPPHGITKVLKMTNKHYLKHYLIVCMLILCLGALSLTTMWLSHSQLLVIIKGDNLTNLMLITAFFTVSTRRSLEAQK